MRRNFEQLKVMMEEAWIAAKVGEVFDERYGGVFG
jgi:hypothetical protein